MVRTYLAAALLVGSSAIAHKAHAQQVDRDAAIAAAARAVADARQAAEESRSTTLRLEQAVTRAEGALDDLRRSLGVAIPNGGPVSTTGTAQSVTQTASAPAAENLPVSDASGAGQRQAAAAALASSVANGPHGAGLTSSPVPELQLTAAAGEAEASLAWTIDLSGTPQPGRLRADQLTLTATGRLNDGEARLLGLDGFPNGTRIQATYVHFWGRTDLTGRSPPEVEVAEANCRIQLRPDTTATCDAEAYDGGVSQFVARFNPGGLELMIERVIPGSVWFIGGEFEGTQSSFKYLDRPSFSIMSEDRFGFGATVFGGALLGPRGMTSVQASFTYRRRYDEQDPVTLIRPIAGSDLLQELTGADGPPERSTQSIAALQLRHAFRSPIGQNARLAVAPEFSFDFNSDAWSIDFPLYFATDGEGKLRGGVRGVYLNRPDATGGRTDDFTVGLFVGVPFSVFRD